MYLSIPGLLNFFPVGKQGLSGYFVIHPKTGVMPSNFTFTMMCISQCYESRGSDCRAVEINSVENGNDVCLTYSVIANITHKTLLVRKGNAAIYYDILNF